MSYLSTTKQLNWMLINSQMNHVVAIRKVFFIVYQFRINLT